MDILSSGSDGHFICRFGGRKHFLLIRDDFTKLAVALIAGCLAGKKQPLILQNGSLIAENRPLIR
jgi:hypothetical protein